MNTNLMYSAIIVEDEYNSAIVLQKLIEEYCPSVTVLDTLGSVADSIGAINRQKPDLVFLDLMLIDGNGLEIIADIKGVDAQIIVTTAYHEYALRALKLSAIDYLLKPISIKELQVAIEKAIRNIQRNDISHIHNFISNFSTNRNERLAIPTSDGHLFLELNDIIKLTAHGSYTQIISTHHTPLMVSKPMKDYEIVLPPDRFIRVHHSHIVNLIHIKKYIRGNGGQLILSDKSLVDVSVRKKELLFKQMKINN